MRSIDFNALKQSLEVTKATLKDGLLSADVFDSATGLSLAAFNSNPAACRLFTQNTMYLRSALHAMGTDRGRYYMVELAQGRAVLVLWHGDDLLEGWMIDAEKVDFGLLFSVAIPQALAVIEHARAA